MAAPQVSVQPDPVRVSGPIPRVGAGFRLLRDPTGFFEQTRARVGDTFLVEAFGIELFCVFSPVGVANLWALPEAAASKGLADFAMLSHKVPAELFAGRRTFPHDLFGRDDVEVYLDNLAAAIERDVAALGASGSFETFAFMRGLAHRMGLASWGGMGAAAPETLDRLIDALDRLDLAESFVHPHTAFITFVTRKRAERRALASIESIYRDGLDRGELHGDLFERICAAWDDTTGTERQRGIARDVVLVHMGSQSNLFAAMAWTLIHLLERPQLLERVRAGDQDLLERCASESIRIAQRSIVLRRTLSEVQLADEKTGYDIAPGVFLATMMSVTNQSAAPGLDRFDPDNYRGRRFAHNAALPARELVTTFGHGRHSCPAQRFSISAIRMAVGRLIETFDLTPRYRDPQPLRRQIGGVARADRPCPIDYRARTAPSRPQQ